MPGPKEYKIVCRSSMLSRAQADLFISRLQLVDNRSTYSIVVKDTAGDLNQQQPLQDVDGKDFFTREIQDFLLSGQADFAVHSLKDVSSELFFKDNHYAIFSREDPRDVAIFKGYVIKKIAAGRPITIGTSSPRRALMATRFLTEALPWVNGKQARVEAVPIRGNVDTRLRKLNLSQYDGIILAAAGLNRLLHYGPSRDMIIELLGGKSIMVLPLIECPPAPGQGALVAETRPGHSEATQLLAQINDESLVDSTRVERTVASKYGAGCHQQFGVVGVKTPYISFTYGSGVSKDRGTFSVYNPHPKLDVTSKRIFSMGDHMKELFHYEYLKRARPLSPALFIASQHALHAEAPYRWTHKKRLWAAGTKTWLDLAKRGFWVEGCADALGLEFIEQWFASPLIGLSRKNITILTDEESAVHWKNDGWQAKATYRVGIKKSLRIIDLISSADIIFWTSFRQYQTYKDHLKPTVIHCCSSGKTVALLKAAGISPVVFPGIKGFNEWRKTNSHIATKDE